MLKHAFLGATATAILSVTFASIASAQAANPEPGYCAQFYPNADCNSSTGPATPGSKPGEAAESDPVEAAPVSPPPKPVKPRKQAHRSASATADTKKPKTDAVAK
jgi:hypothetical protein